MPTPCIDEGTYDIAQDDPRVQAGHKVSLLSPPSWLREAAMFHTGELPDFDEVKAFFYMPSETRHIVLKEMRERIKGGKLLGNCPVMPNHLEYVRGRSSMLMAWLEYCYCLLDGAPNAERTLLRLLKGCADKNKQLSARWIAASNATSIDEFLNHVDTIHGNSSGNAVEDKWKEFEISNMNPCNLFDMMRPLLYTNADKNRARQLLCGKMNT